MAHYVADMAGRVTDCVFGGWCLSSCVFQVCFMLDSLKRRADPSCYVLHLNIHWLWW